MKISLDEDVSRADQAVHCCEEFGLLQSLETTPLRIRDSSWANSSRTRIDEHSVVSRLTANCSEVSQHNNSQ